MRYFMAFVFLGVLAALLPAPTMGLPLPTGQVRVIDGDTLVAGGLRLRLHGIDAPELRQTCPLASGKTWACGIWARDQLRNLTRGKRLACSSLGTDRYDRQIVRCTVDGQDLAAAMVRAGAAMAYRKYSTDHVAAEAQARQRAVGIWQSEGAQPPAEHRLAGSAPPDGCLIKGNVSGNGHVYHSPGQTHYAATRINPAKGERWFCTSTEAEAAGFRPALR